MKRITLLFALLVIGVSCEVDENANQLDPALQGQDLNPVLETLSSNDFISYMEGVAIDEGAVGAQINPDTSVYGPGIETVEAFFTPIDAKMDASCVSQKLVSDDGRELGDFNIVFFEDETGANKVRYEYKTNKDWFVYAVLMNIDADCSMTPTLSNDEPNLNQFNIRDCFANGMNDIQYTFDRGAFNECSCVAAYSIIYNVDANGYVDECIGVWANGETFNMSPTAKTIEYCNGDCEF